MTNNYGDDSIKFCTSYERYNQSHVKIKNDKGVIDELKAYHFSDEINNRADAIIRKMNPKTRRGKIRKGLLFYGVYLAHEELGCKIPPIEIGKPFGLDQGGITKAYSRFSSPSETEYCNFSGASINKSPVDFFEVYLEKMGLDKESIQQACILANQIIKKEKALLQASPQTVASGLVHYYAGIMGINVEISIISEITGRSQATIKNTSLKLRRIDNS